MEKKTGKNRIYDNRLLWVILALIGSMLVWFYVNSTGEIKELTFVDIPVVFVGQENLREQRSIILTDISNTVVTVRLKGPSRELMKLNKSNLTANVDLSPITGGTTTYQLTYILSYPENVNSSNIELVTRIPSNIRFSIDRLSSTLVEVRGEFKGNIAEGYVSEGALVFEPANVKVFGPERVLNLIDHAWVLIEREDVDRLNVDSTYVLIGEDGEPVDTAELTFDLDTVNVTLPISAKKTVPLKVDVLEGGGATNENAIIKIFPPSIDLAGDATILDGLNNIVLGTVDLSDFEMNYEETFNIVIDNGLRNLTGAETAKVTVEIKGLETKKFTATNIELTNVATGVTPDIMTQSVGVTIRAKPSVLEQIQPNNIRIVADMTEYASVTGVVTPTVRISVDGFTEEAGAVGDYWISVNLDRSG